VKQKVKRSIIASFQIPVYDLDRRKVYFYYDVLLSLSRLLVQTRYG
jgi:hypothetical protein